MSLALSQRLWVAPGPKSNNKQNSSPPLIGLEPTINSGLGRDQTKQLETNVSDFAAHIDRRVVLNRDSAVALVEAQRLRQNSTVVFAEFPQWFGNINVDQVNRQHQRERERERARIVPI